MKKLLALLLIVFSVSTVTFAQDSKDKTKKTSTLPQKVHNTFSKHKEHNGHKSKHVHNGHKTTHKHTDKVNKTKSD